MVDYDQGKILPLVMSVRPFVSCRHCDTVSTNNDLRIIFIAALKLNISRSTPATNVNAVISQYLTLVR